MHGQSPAHHGYLAVNPRPVRQDPFNLFSIPLLTHGPKILHSLGRAHMISAHTKNIMGRDCFSGFM